MIFRSLNKSLLGRLRSPLERLERRNFSCKYDDGIILTSPFLISLLSSSITAFFTITIITSNTNGNAYQISERLKRLEEREKQKEKENKNF
jgi:hypothetical protein